MQLSLYQKPTGHQAKIAEEYYESISILNRYTPTQLKNWKHIDLYFILNLDTLRHEPISEKLLQEQYRNQLVRYQKSIRSCSELFLIIKRAYEILNNPSSRSKYDSFFFNENIPEDRFYEGDEFFKVFTPVFKRYAPFSTKGQAPMLGTANDSKESVENFYKFWRTFDSWRRFEYFDDDNTEGMNSADRRYYEKKNKTNRDRLKKEDILRIKTLVEIALRRDPRVLKFKGEGTTNKSKITVNKKLINKNWQADELIGLNDLIIKYKNGAKYDWPRIIEEFNQSTTNKKDEKDLLIKGNEIIRMGIRNK